MAYPNFGKVRTLVLPTDFLVEKPAGISLDQYKNHYGIDLKDFIYIDENEKILRLKNLDKTLLLLSTNFYNNEATDVLNTILPISYFESSPFVEGSSNARLKISCFTSEYAIQIYIDQDEAFTLDNAKIAIVEI